MATRQSRRGEATLFAGVDRDNRMWKPINELLEDRQMWTPSGLEIIVKGNTRLSKAIQDPLILYKSDKEDVLARLAEARDNVPVIDEQDSAVVGSVIEMKGHLTKIKLERSSSSARKSGAGLQSFLSKFADFLESYSGIVEMIKGADQQYGGLAYGTMSLLLSVAVHKQKLEEAHEEAIEELTFALPRLHTLKGLEPSAQLRESVANVFALVIEFSRETSAYYSASSRIRVWRSMKPKTQKLPTMTRIRKQMLQIREESDLLMLRKIEGMRKSVEEMHMRVRKLERLADRVQWSSDETYLAKLREKLQHRERFQVRDNLPNTDVHLYKRRLAEAFKKDRAKADQPCDVTWELFTEEGLFTDWLECDNSCMLLLGGSNLPHYSCGTLNWLSHASVFAIEHLQKQQQNVIYWLCQTDYTVPRRRQSSLQQIMANILYQVARCHPDHLRSRLGDIEEALQREVWWSEDEEMNAIDEMENLLTSLLSDFDPNDSMTLVIDRLDQCEWHDEEDSGPNSSMAYFLERLCEVVSRARCRMKILLVMDANLAQRIHDRHETCRRKAGGKYLYKPDWTHEMEEERQGRIGAIKSELDSSPRVEMIDARRLL